jgi:hypothetical protein
VTVRPDAPTTLHRYRQRTLELALQWPTPIGVSGEVFLLPVQVSLLGVPSPAVTPTNLLFNVVATQAACCATAAGADFDEGSRQRHARWARAAGGSEVSS